MTDQDRNYWRFERVGPEHCCVRDASNTVYLSVFGDLAAHKCQDFMRWTQAPDTPGGKPNEHWALKPEEVTA